MRQGAIGAHAAVRYLVPLARANFGHCERLADAVAPERMSNRQVGELYVAYMRGGTKARELILSAPAVALRAREEAARSLWRWALRFDAHEVSEEPSVP